MLSRYAAAIGSVLVGCQGPMGPPGPAGAASDQRLDGAPDRTEEAGIECDWCASGALSCTPDQNAVQNCVDNGDGDGCGHWEKKESCTFGCGPIVSDERDDLGNHRLAMWGCLAKQDAGAVDAGADGSIQRCNADASPCDAAVISQGRCEAVIKTAYDHLTHEFSAKTMSATGSCTGSDDSYSYWNASERRSCAIQVRARDWSESSLGFDGHPISEFTMSVSGVTDAGPLDAGICMTNLDATNFSLSRERSCTVMITSAHLEPGGAIEGIFASSGRLTQLLYDDPDASTISITGKFRWGIPSK